MRNTKSIFKTGIILLLVLSLGLVLNGCGKKEAQTLKEGVYTESVEAYHGKIEITTKIGNEGKIVDISVGENTETEGIGTLAIDKIPKLIIEKQSLDVDGISGATITVDAIIKGVAGSIEKAGGNTANFGLKEVAEVKGDYVLPAIDKTKLPEVAEKTGTVMIKDAKGREVEISLPVSRYAVSTMDVLEYIIPLKGEDTFNLLVGSGQDGGHGLNSYAELYTPVVGNYMEHAGQISDHNSPFDLEMILSMEPEVIITNSAMGAHKYALEVEDVLESAGIKIILVDVPGKNLETSVQDTMKILGKIFQEEEKANEVITFIDDQFELIASKNLAKKENQPTVYYEKSGYSEVFGSTSTSKGGWGLPIKIAGGKNIADPVLLSSVAAKGASNTLDPEYVLEQNPDFLIFSGINDGWLSILKTKKDPTFDILKRNGWSNLDAVKNGQVYEFAHSTSRSIYAFYPTLKMAKLFYPEEFVDVNPEAILDEFFDKFMILDSDISTWFIDADAKNGK